MVFLSVYLFLFCQLIFVGWVDYQTKKVSNYWFLINLSFYVLFLCFFPQGYPFSWETFFYPFVFLLVGFGLFCAKIMGAGDTKYLFSFFLLIPVKFHESFFLLLLYSTMAIGFALFFYNTFKNIDKIRTAFMLKDISLIKGVYGKKFAYTPVIAVTWVLFGWKIRFHFVY